MHRNTVRTNSPLPTRPRRSRTRGPGSAGVLPDRGLRTSPACRARTALRGVEGTPPSVSHLGRRQAIPRRPLPTLERELAAGRRRRWSIRARRHAGHAEELTVSDNGVPFNPVEQVAPRTDQTLDERKIGGLGLHLVRNLADDVAYRREDDKNALTLGFELSPETAPEKES